MCFCALVFLLILCFSYFPTVVYPTREWIYCFLWLVFAVSPSLACQAQHWLLLFCRHRSLPFAFDLPETIWLLF
uniref:Putative secreted peptide n=1 Tax=Anopheles braziliensis TaxID=58242 RepID=A0A2M3ZRC7_9DIPT